MELAQQLKSKDVTLLLDSATLQHTKYLNLMIGSEGKAYFWTTKAVTRLFSEVIITIIEDVIAELKSLGVFLLLSPSSAFSDSF